VSGAGEELRPELAELRERLARTEDEVRREACERRHARGQRTARENLADLVDPDSFVEYGQLAVAAQRNRRDYLELQSATAADGVITGIGTINAGRVPAQAARAAVAIYDYTVLAGTQGFYHHQKLDRLFDLAGRESLPVVMFTEGGGGRPGDTDVSTQVAGLSVPTFARWAALRGRSLRIAVNSGFCFAGNAALFGCADITIATRASWIGMAGPAMIEGGGLGVHEPTAVGPAATQARNGVIDILAEDEAGATQSARQVLAMFQGRLPAGEAPAQQVLRELIPPDRRFPYDVRAVIRPLADAGSWIEFGQDWAKAMVTGFLRIAGRPVALLANDCRVLGGAIDAAAADKATRFLQLLAAYPLPLVSLVDTPGFMVGPRSEEEAAVRRMPAMFTAGAAIRAPWLAVVLRRGYGLGAMAMTGGSFARPLWMAAWPTGEFGAMGLEGAVRLGYRKELDAIADPAERRARFDALLARLYETGKAIEAASHLEIDAVIDPADTRVLLLRALDAAGRD
jgi:acetyl-CoA carboxylase carboxyltransferase component